MLHLRGAQRTFQPIAGTAVPLQRPSATHQKDGTTENPSLCAHHEGKPLGAAGWGVLPISLDTDAKVEFGSKATETPPSH